MTNPGSGGNPRKPWEQQLNEAGARLDEELRRVVRYVDEEVVPEVRRNGSRALRIASDRLRELAEQMEAARPPAPPPAAKAEAPKDPPSR